MLEILIREYKEIGQEIIRELEKDGFKNLESILAKRDLVNQNIKSMQIDKGEFNELVRNLEIEKLDRNIIKKMSEMKNSLKIEIKKVQKTQKANTTYNNAQNRVQFLNLKL